MDETPVSIRRCADDRRNAGGREGWRPRAELQGPTRASGESCSPTRWSQQQHEASGPEAISFIALTPM